jgi:mRNA-degrading endonuclease YafQ of YafQ-DinJ toxin-antitoxin module
MSDSSTHSMSPLEAIESLAGDADWAHAYQPGGEEARSESEEAVAVLKGLIEQVERLENRLRDAPLGGDGSHWEDCHRSHIDCARARIDSLYEQVEALRRERDAWIEEARSWGSERGPDAFASTPASTPEPREGGDDA